MAVHLYSRVVLAIATTLTGCGSSSAPSPPIAPQVIANSKSQPESEAVPATPRPQAVEAEVDDASEFASPLQELPEREAEQAKRASVKPTREQLRVPSDLDIEDLSYRRPSSREWTAKGGGFKVNARLVAFVEGVAVLQKDDGKLARVPLDKLSEADVQFLKDIIKVHPKAYIVTGVVTSVTNASELVITNTDGKHAVELFGIAPPKIGQYYHNEAKEALTTKVANKQVWLEWSEKSESGKPIGILYRNGRNINLEMVAEGMAWRDPKYTAEPKFLNAETIAKSKRIGLWNNADVKAPWEVP